MPIAAVIELSRPLHLRPKRLQLFRSLPEQIPQRKRPWRLFRLTAVQNPFQVLLHGGVGPQIGRIVRQRLPAQPEDELHIGLGEGQPLLLPGGILLFPSLGV